MQNLTAYRSLKFYVVENLPVMIERMLPGWYLFRGPSDQTVGPSVSFTIENRPPSGRPCNG